MSSKINHLTLFVFHEMLMAWTNKKMHRQQFVIFHKIIMYSYSKTPPLLRNHLCQKNLNAEYTCKVQDEDKETKTPNKNIESYPAVLKSQQDAAFKYFYILSNLRKLNMSSVSVQFWSVQPVSFCLNMF